MWADVVDLIFEDNELIKTEVIDSNTEKNEVDERLLSESEMDAKLEDLLYGFMPIGLVVLKPDKRGYMNVPSSKEEMDALWRQMEIDRNPYIIPVLE